LAIRNPQPLNLKSRKQKAEMANHFSFRLFPIRNPQFAIRNSSIPGLFFFPPRLNLGA
jgi:hypothetical protein